MSNPKDFEQSIASLEEIVAQLEQGDLPLEKSLKQFEKGIQLAQQCQKILTNAEQKIEQLSTTSDDGKTTLLMNDATIDYYYNRHQEKLKHFLCKTPVVAPQLKEAIEYVLFPGGKRIRPIFVYLCGELAEVPIHCCDVLAIAIELIHCYSLVHDDLPAMDNDDYRRGKLSCHRAFDEPTAILIGDGLQTLAIELLATHLPDLLPEKNSIEIIKIVTKAIGFNGMVSGQSLDLSELASPDLCEKELRQIHHLKTGSLFSACAEVVITAGNPNKTITTALQNIATQFGLVFQMQDDYLDQYGQKELSGKNRASDVANNKTTFATLYSEAGLKALIQESYKEINEYIKYIQTDTRTLDIFIKNFRMRAG